MPSYNHLIILESPITERMVKPGDVGQLDSSTNQIRVNGNWFPYDPRWKTINPTHVPDLFNAACKCVGPIEHMARFPEHHQLFDEKRSQERFEALRQAINQVNGDTAI